MACLSRYVIISYFSQYAAVSLERSEEKLSSPRVDINSFTYQGNHHENKYFISRPQYLAKDETK